MNFGSGPAAGGGDGGAKVTVGPDLAQVETEQLAFQTLAGESKLRLLTSPWPADHLPSTTSSLLSIAPTKGLLAAAGPDTLVIASTDSVRRTVINEAADGESKTKTFSPQATIQIPRVSHVIFSSDESCLVIAAERGGGLAVYDTNALLSGGKEPVFQLATEGQGVRQILPNPNPDQNLSRYFGIVTENGQLLLADLKEQKLVSGANGSPVFHSDVSCACWSRLGKQIVAGLANGTAVQIDQQGIVRAEIPEPPQLAEWKDPNSRANPITSIFWLETYDFLLVHTPVNPPDAAANDDSIYHVAHRDKASSTWIFSKLPDPCPAFGLERKPANHFILRLRDWVDLIELLILSSTASTDIGLFTRSKTPLDPEHAITDVFTYTQPPDARRAAMPLGENGDASPIGMAVDLSVKEKVPRPIPTDETLDESPVPMPALMVLDQEGMLSAWWVIYKDAVRKAEAYPDLVVAGGPRALGGEQKGTPATAHAHPGPTGMPSSSSFGMSSTSPPPPQQQTPAFGQSSFGSPSTAAFGGTSSLGNRPSPWAAGSSTTGPGPKFGQPTFGSPATFGQSSFGQATGMGTSKASVWGTPQQSQQSPTTRTSGSVFGGNASNQSPFMSLGSKTALSSFSALGNSNQPSAFAPPSTKPSLQPEPSGSTVSFGTGTSFGSGSTTFGITSFGTSSPAKASMPASREESMEDEGSETSTARPPPSQAPSGGDEQDKSNTFGLGAGGFKLGSTFKGDGSAKDDLPKPKDPGAGLFGKGFGDALGLGETRKGSEPPSGSEGAAWLSGRSTPVVKKEPGTEEERKLSDIPPAEPEKKVQPVDDAPLPPDPTTWKPKPGAMPPPIPPGFGSDFGMPSSSKEDAPLPPDFTTQGMKAEDAPLPPDFASPPKKTSAQPPPAESPPVDLGTGVAVTAGPPESEDEDGDWEDDEEGEVDDEGDDDGDGAEERAVEIQDPKGLSAFEARLAPASPKRQPTEMGYDTSTTPATEKKESYTPAGLPKAPIIFPAPQRNGQESPRSPSPVRSATSPMRMMPNFGTQQQGGSRAPSGMFGASQSTSAFGGPQQVPSSQPRAATSQAQPPQRIAVSPAQLVQKPSRPTAPSKPAEPESGELEDEEDARIQAILAAPIEPTTEAPAFLAHQDYVAGGEKADDKAGLGGQIERVYRDVNSMLDTLALNARSLQGFVEGNMSFRAPGDERRGRLDLEEENGWVLGQTSELEGIMEGIEVELEDGRLEDVRGLLEGLREEEKEVGRLRIKGVEARKVIKARSDPDEQALQLAAPLPMETAAQQSELRQGVQKVQTLLAKAEEQLSLLRAELASLQRAQGGGSAGVPTVEAVTNTILKMTAMIEKKSGDIDVLESQIRRLPGGLAALHKNQNLEKDYEDDLAASMKASRISHRASLSASRAANFRVSAYGSPAASRRTLRDGKGTPGTPGARRSLLDVSEAEVEEYRVKREGRRKAMERLRELVEVKGARVVKVGG